MANLNKYMLAVNNLLTHSKLLSTPYGTLPFSDSVRIWYPFRPSLLTLIKYLALEQTDTRLEISLCHRFEDNSMGAITNLSSIVSLVSSPAVVGRVRLT